MPDAYLDHAASSPLRPEARAAVLAALDEHYANPTGAHHLARAARKCIDDAREQLAELAGVPARGVIFTGGGTEADNLAINGARTKAMRATVGAGAVACSAVEHHAVLHPVEHRGGIIVPVDANGMVDLDSLADTLRAASTPVALVSVMGVNNETGVVTPMADVAELVRQFAPDAVLHCDAVQAAAWMPLADIAAHVDALSLSAHKLGGPKGVGALIVQPEVMVSPMILGGGQEQERRSGTHDTAGIAGFVAAAAANERDDHRDRIAAMRDRLIDALQGAVDGVHETSPRHLKVAGNAHVLIDGIESEALLFLLDRAGICASAGSSCSSGAVSISHVLAAMGIDAERGRGAVRFTLGWTTTDVEIDHVIDVLPDLVRKLRR
ncbi:MAG: cysteine desulfurase family protein [Acidimicrobiia bacterium]